MLVEVFATMEISLQRTASAFKCLKTRENEMEFLYTELTIQQLLLLTSKVVLFLGTDTIIT